MTTYKIPQTKFNEKSSENVWRIAEKFVPLQCRNKDGGFSLGQPKIVFRPDKFYGLPRAQKYRQEIDRKR